MTLDNNTLNEKIANIDESVNEFNEITERVIKEQSADLDDLMQAIHYAVTQENAISTDAVERYYAELSSLVYFMSERIEKLNVFKDVSKATAKEAYNKAYIRFCAEKDEKGKSIRTVNENTALAETDSQYEVVMQSIYGNAYDAVKLKLDLALEMLSTLKHILKRRMNEEYMDYQMANMKMNVVGDED